VPARLLLISKVRACRTFRCVFHDHSDTTDPTDACYALRILSIANNALCIVVTNNTAEEYVAPFDGDVYLEN
jgi:hypothetical protein